MREKINWSLFNTVFKTTPNSLCVGEERALSDDEIRTINAGLVRMNEAYSSFVLLFGEAMKRFMSSKS
jgi:hypothetical protein